MKDTISSLPGATAEFQVKLSMFHFVLLPPKTFLSKLIMHNCWLFLRKLYTYRLQGVNYLPSIKIYIQNFIMIPITVWRREGRNDRLEPKKVHSKKVWIKSLPHPNKQRFQFASSNLEDDTSSYFLECLEWEEQKMLWWDGYQLPSGL